MSKNSKCFTRASTTAAIAQAGKEPAQATPLKHPVPSVIKEIRYQTRKYYSAEEKTRIVLEGLRDEPLVTHNLAHCTLTAMLCQKKATVKKDSFCL
jgi:hypothetical protein